MNQLVLFGPKLVRCKCTKPTHLCIQLRIEPILEIVTPDTTKPQIELNYQLLRFVSQPTLAISQMSLVNTLLSLLDEMVLQAVMYTAPVLFCLF